MQRDDLTADPGRRVPVMKILLRRFWRLDFKPLLLTRPWMKNKGVSYQTVEKRHPTTRRLHKTALATATGSSDQLPCESYARHPVRERNLVKRSVPYELLLREVQGAMKLISEMTTSCWYAKSSVSHQILDLLR